MSKFLKKINMDVYNKYYEIVKQYIRNVPDIDVYRKKAKLFKFLTIFFLLSFVAAPILINRIFGLEHIRLMIIAYIFIIIGLFITIICSNKSKSVLYTDILPKILKVYNSDIEYEHLNGLDQELYNSGEFEGYDRYNSRDFISGKLEGLSYIMSGVHTEDVSTDDEGNTTYTTVFSGFVAYIELPKSFNGSISIGSGMPRRFNRDDYIIIDNEEFEKMYNVYSTDKIKGMRLLTPDVTVNMMDVKKNTGFDLDVHIFDNRMYMRVHGTSCFNLSFSNEEKEVSEICYSVAILDSMLKTMENFVKEIKDFE